MKILAGKWYVAGYDGAPPAGSVPVYLDPEDGDLRCTQDQLGLAYLFYNSDERRKSQAQAMWQAQSDAEVSVPAALPSGTVIYWICEPTHPPQGGAVSPSQYGTGAGGKALLVGIGAALLLGYLALR